MGTAVQLNEYYVYKLYNRLGELLYVGFTTNWRQRRKDHKSRQHWFSEVAREELETFTDELTAQLREVTLIFDERPRYNRTYNVDVAPDYLAPYLAEAKMMPDGKKAKRGGPPYHLDAAPVQAMRDVAIACGCKGVFCHLDCEDVGFCQRASLTDTNLLEIPVPGQHPEPAPPRSWLKRHEEEERQRQEKEQQRRERRRAARRAATASRQEMIREQGRQAACAGLPRHPPYTTMLGKPNSHSNRLWLEGYDRVISA